MYQVYSMSAPRALGWRSIRRGCAEPPQVRRAPPPLARVEGFEATPISPQRDEDFRIVSTGGGRVVTAVTPDAAVCADCLAELFDPSHRHYRYPFLTCTNCGPRYTITHTCLTTGRRRPWPTSPFAAIARRSTATR